MFVCENGQGLNKAQVKLAPCMKSNNTTVVRVLKTNCNYLILVSYETITKCCAILLCLFFRKDQKTIYQPLRAAHGLTANIR